MCRPKLTPGSDKGVKIDSARIGESQTATTRLKTKARNATACNMACTRLSYIGADNMSIYATFACSAPSLVGIEPLAQIGLQFAPSGDRLGSPLPFEEGADGCWPLIVGGDSHRPRVSGRVVEVAKVLGCHPDGRHGFHPGVAPLAADIHLQLSPLGSVVGIALGRLQPVLHELPHRMVTKACNALTRFLGPLSR